MHRIKYLPVLLSLAISDLLFAAEIYSSPQNNLSLYGEFQYIYLSNEHQINDPDESLDEEPPARSGDESLKKINDFTDNGSLIGLEGEHVIGDSLSAFFLVEWEYTADQNNGDGNSGSLQTAESYAGLEGDFGSVRIGNWDGIYTEAISDVLNPFEYEGPSEFLSFEEPGDMLSYTSPELGNISFSLQTSLKGNGAGIDNDGDGKADGIHSVSTVVRYADEYLIFAFGYDDRALLNANADAQFGIAASFDLQPFSIAAKIETAGESNNNTNDGFNAVGLVAGLEYDYGVLTLAIQQITHETEIRALREDRTEYVLNANFELSESLYFYIESAQYNKFLDQDDYSALGIYFSF